MFTSTSIGWQRRSADRPMQWCWGTKTQDIVSRHSTDASEPTVSTPATSSEHFYMSRRGIWFKELVSKSSTSPSTPDEYEWSIWYMPIQLNCSVRTLPGNWWSPVPTKSELSQPTVCRELQYDVYLVCWTVYAFCYFTKRIPLIECGWYW